MSAPDTGKLVALLRELGPQLETAAFFGLDARWTYERVADWLVARGVGVREAEPPPKSIGKIAGAISDIERVRDVKMWRRLNGELVWVGQTPDGNEIETESPLTLLENALTALQGLRVALKAK